MTNFFSAMGFTFASLYFDSHGLPLYGIVVMAAIGPAVAMLIVAIFRTFYVRAFLILGALAYTMRAIALIFYFNYSFVLYGIFGGVTLGLFWVSLNYVFFKKSVITSHAKDSSVYFIVPQLLAMLLPPLGAFVIRSTSFIFLFSVTGVLSLIPAVYAYRNIEPLTLTNKFRDTIQRFSGLKLITFVEGALHYFQSTFVPIYILLFVNTAFGIGGFESYLALIGFAVTIVLARHSDKKRSRLGTLKPILWLMGILILALGLIHNWYVWLLLIGVYAFLDNISLPLRFALPMDYKDKDMGFWRVSEFYGNFGRVVFLGISAVLFYMHMYIVAFVLFAVLAASYPLMIKYCTRHLNEKKLSL